MEQFIEIRLEGDGADWAALNLAKRIEHMLRTEFGDYQPRMRVDRHLQIIRPGVANSPPAPDPVAHPPKVI